MCERGYPSPQCEYRAFDTTGNLAIGDRVYVVSNDQHDCCPEIHRTEFVNDGFYGNGRSWIGTTPDQWIKFDLGCIRRIDRIQFGRDRLSGFNDRDPG